MSDPCTPIPDLASHRSEPAGSEFRRLVQAFEHSASGMALLSMDGRWLEVNPAFCELVGQSRERLLGRSFVELTHAEDIEASIERMHQLQRCEIRSFGFEKRYLRPDGSTVWVRLEVALVVDDAGAPEFIISQAHDVTASRRVRDQLADREASLRSVIRSMGEGVLVIDADGSISLANERAREILQIDDDMLRWISVRDLAARCIAAEAAPAGDDELAAFPPARTLATGEATRELVARVRAPGGEERWIEISTEPVREDVDDRPRAVVATFSDITKRVQTERALKASEERLSLALEGAKLGMWDWLLDRQLLTFNTIAERILGYRSGDVAPHLESVRDLVHPADEDRLVAAMEAHLSDERPFFEVDVRMRRKSGGYVWTNLRGQVTERLSSGRPVRVTGMLIDISQRKELEARLERLATTDSLTGLFNRRHGVEVLRNEIERARRTGATFSLVLMDIDHFKSVNDRFGHDVGDRVLSDVAALLGRRLRRIDTAARWGGEEFALILPETAREDARRFAGELLERMDEIRTPDGEPIGASFGVVDYRQDESASDLVKRADRLMYRAKHAGRARVESEGETPAA